MLAYNNFSYIYIGQPLHNQTQIGSTTKPLTLHTKLTRKKIELHNRLNSLNLKGFNHLHLQLLASDITDCNVQYFWYLLTLGGGGGGGGLVAPPLSFFLSKQRKTMRIVRMSGMSIVVGSVHQ